MVVVVGVVGSEICDYLVLRSQVVAYFGKLGLKGLDCLTLIHEIVGRVKPF
jgi:hypothetical protein